MLGDNDGNLFGLVMLSPVILFFCVAIYGGIPQLLDDQTPISMVYTFSFDDAPQKATHYSYCYYYYVGGTRMADTRYGSYWMGATDIRILKPVSISLNNLKHTGTLSIEYTYYQKTETQKGNTIYTEYVKLFSGVKEVEINPWGKT